VETVVRREQLGECLDCSRCLTLRETDAEATDRETLIRNLMDGQYGYSARIVAFNTAEGWSRDVTVDIADELRRRFAEYDEVPRSVQEFLEIAVRR